MAGVLEELDSKLSSTFQIKNKPMTNGDEVDKLELLSSLLRLYDESWAIEGTRVIFGHHQGKGTERSHQLKRSQEQRKLRGFLRLADLGHLAAEGESLVGKKFSRLISGVLSKLETRYGSSLPSKVRSMTAGGGHQLKKGKENVSSSPHPPVAPVSRVPLLEVNHAPVEEECIPTGKQLARTPPKEPPPLQEADQGKKEDQCLTPAERRVSSFYSPSTSDLSRQLTRQPRRIHNKEKVAVSPSEFDLSLVPTSGVQIPRTPDLPRILETPSPPPQPSPQAPGDSSLPLPPPPSIQSSSATKPTGSTLADQRREVSPPPPPPPPVHATHHVDANPAPVVIESQHVIPRPITPELPGSDFIPSNPTTPQISNLVATHVIPTGRQLAATPATGSSNSQSRCTVPEPSGRYELPSALEAVAIPTEEELEKERARREEDQERKRVLLAKELEKNLKEQKLKEEAEERKRKVAEEKRKKLEAEQEERRKLEEDKRELLLKEKLLAEKERQMADEVAREKAQMALEKERLIVEKEKALAEEVAKKVAMEKEKMLEEKRLMEEETLRRREEAELEKARLAEERRELMKWREEKRKMEELEMRRKQEEEETRKQLEREAKEKEEQIEMRSKKDEKHEEENKQRSRREKQHTEPELAPEKGPQTSVICEKSPRNKICCKEKSDSVLIDQEVLPGPSIASSHKANLKQNLNKTDEETEDSLELPRQPLLRVPSRAKLRQSRLPPQRRGLGPEGINKGEMEANLEEEIGNLNQLSQGLSVSQNRQSYEADVIEDKDIRKTKPAKETIQESDSSDKVTLASSPSDEQGKEEGSALRIDKGQEELIETTEKKIQDLSDTPVKLDKKGKVKRRKCNEEFEKTCNLTSNLSAENILGGEAVVAETIYEEVKIKKVKKVKRIIRMGRGPAKSTRKVEKKEETNIISKGKSGSENPPQHRKSRKSQQNSPVVANALDKEVAVVGRRRSKRQADLVEVEPCTWSGQDLDHADIVQGELGNISKSVEASAETRAEDNSQVAEKRMQRKKMVPIEDTPTPYKLRKRITENLRGEEVKLNVKEGVQESSKTLARHVSEGANKARLSSKDIKKAEEIDVKAKMTRSEDEDRNTRSAYEEEHRSENKGAKEKGARRKRVGDVVVKVSSPEKKAKDEGRKVDLAEDSSQAPDVKGEKLSRRNKRQDRTQQIETIELEKIPEEENKGETLETAKLPKQNTRRGKQGEAKKDKAEVLESSMMTKLAERRRRSEAMTTSNWQETLERPRSENKFSRAKDKGRAAKAPPSKADSSLEVKLAARRSKVDNLAGILEGGSAVGPSAVEKRDCPEDALLAGDLSLISCVPSPTKLLQVPMTTRRRKGSKQVLSSKIEDENSGMYQTAFEEQVGDEDGSLSRPRRNCSKRFESFRGVDTDSTSDDLVECLKRGRKSKVITAPKVTPEEISSSKPGPPLATSTGTKQDKVLLHSMRDELYSTPSTHVVNINYETPLNSKGVFSSVCDEQFLTPAEELQPRRRSTRSRKN